MGAISDNAEAKVLPFIAFEWRTSEGTVDFVKPHHGSQRRFPARLQALACPLLLLVCFAPLKAAPLLKVTADADGRGATIEVSPSQPGVSGLLEVLDAQGECLKTLRAGRFTTGRPFHISIQDGLKPGPYRIRYREDLTLTPDQDLLLPRKEKWVNPCDVAITGKGVYILDRGIPATEAVVKKEEGASGEAPTDQGATHVYKFTHDGKPDPSFGDRGRATISEKPSSHIVVSLAADPSGYVYLPSELAEVRVFDPTGAVPAPGIGGSAEGAQSTTWAGALTLGPGKLIYIFSGGLRNLSVYDRTSAGFEGFRYGLKTERTGTTSRSIGSDRRGAIYMATQTDLLLQKIDDTGKELKESYRSDPSDKMYLPMGPSAEAGLIWVADHGPGGGPFWDSGGGGEVLLFWDSGRELSLVSRFGSPGLSKDKLEFLNPCSTAQTPDHLGLWVMEDGLPNADGPPGNARVRRFKIGCARSEEATVELKSP